jgi:hypothetical protein
MSGSECSADGGIASGGFTGGGGALPTTFNGSPGFCWPLGSGVTFDDGATLDDDGRSPSDRAST